VANWRLTPGFCLDELFDRSIVPFEECTERAQAANLEDLQGGLYIFRKQAHALMCTQSKSEQSVTNYFIDSMFEADTNEEFQKIRDDEVQPTATYTFLQPPVDDTVLQSLDAGY